MKLCGVVPYQASINVQLASDALLFPDWTDGLSDGMLTGKLLEYLGSGDPIRAAMEGGEVVCRDYGLFGRFLTFGQSNS